MKLSDILIQEHMITSQAEGRRAVFQGVIKLNDVIVTNMSVEVESGDTVQFGKHKTIVVGEKKWTQ